MNVALFCVFRNEHIYINEFIEHYLNLGFNHIYLIDNSSNDKLDNMLNPKFKSDVSIIDIRSENVIDWDLKEVVFTLAMLLPRTSILV